MAQFQALPDHEVRKRIGFLKEEIRLSSSAIQKLQKLSKKLCCPLKARERMTNLAQLGFQSPQDLVEDNPTLLIRSEHTVRKRFHMVRMWLEFLDPHVDIYDLFDRRPQLWSVGRKKFVTICMLLLTGRCKNATPERVCNLITLNLEDVLITYMSNPSMDCMTLHRLARKRARSKELPILQKEQKQKLIFANCSLPMPVIESYQR